MVFDRRGGVLAFVLGGVIALSASSGTQPEEPDAGVRALDAVLPSVVAVEFTARYDNAEAPGVEWPISSEDSMAEEGRGWETLIGQDRPQQSTGFLVAPDVVIGVDPLLHPRFVRSVAVRVGGEVIPAAIESFALAQNAVALRLERPAAGARPLSFTPDASGPYTAVHRRDNDAMWWAGAASLSNETWRDENGLTVRGSPWPAAIVGGGAGVVGLTFTSDLAVDGSWMGTPESWDWISAAELEASFSRISEVADATVVRVELRFRSPRAESNAADMWGSSDDGEEITEWNGPGVRVGERGLVVLATLGPRVTARLETIRAIMPDGRGIEASFMGTLRDFGAFVAELGEEGPAPAALHEGDIRALEHKLLARVQVRVRGEHRSTYVWRGRLAEFRRDRGGNPVAVYGEVKRSDLVTGDGEEGPRSVLFTLDGSLAALPLPRRARPTDSGEWSYGRLDYEPTVLGASELLGVLGRGDGAYAPDNRPTGEEEQDRLAWLGVEMQAMDPDLARFGGVVEQTSAGEFGGIVTHVYPGSPAAVAGVVVGDVLLRVHVEGQPRPLEVVAEESDMSWGSQYLEAMEQITPEYFERIPPPWGSVETDLTRALTEVGFSTPFRLELFREGEVTEVEMTVTEGPSRYESAARFKSEETGLTVRELTYEARRFFQMSDNEAGVLISGVEAGSRAAVAGLKPFEVVTSINDSPMRTIADFEASLAGGGELRLSVKRMHAGRLVKLRAGGE